MASSLELHVKIVVPLCATSAEPSGSSEIVNPSPPGRLGGVMMMMVEMTRTPTAWGDRPWV